MATGGDEDITDQSQDVDYNISYITTWADTAEKTDGTVVGSYEHGLRFSGYVEKNISVKALRWISKRTYSHFPDTPKSALVISYLDEETKTVGNVFFETKKDSVAMPTNCFESIFSLLAEKYRRLGGDLEQTDQVVDIDQVVEVVSKLPIFMGNVQMSVVSAGDGDIDIAVATSEGDQLDFLMILDPECMCLYQGELREPVHRLMFWEEEDVNSVERVKLAQKTGQSEKTLYLQTKTMSFAYNANAELITQIQSLIPKKKYLLTNPLLMLETLPKLRYIQPVSRSSRPDIGLSESLYTGRAGASGWNEVSNSVEATIATRIEGELATAELNFRGNEDMQNIWVAVEFDLKEIIDDGKWPATDYRSGGMDADNGEHLEKAINDVMDKLRENNLPIAISRLLACRELFGTSAVKEIRQIFDKSDMDLLRLLYFRSLLE